MKNDQQELGTMQTLGDKIKVYQEPINTYTCVINNDSNDKYVLPYPMHISFGKRTKYNIMNTCV